MDAVLGMQTFGGLWRGNHCLAHSQSFQYLVLKSSSNPQGNYRDHRLGEVRPNVGNFPDELYAGQGSEAPGRGARLGDRGAPPDRGR